VLLRITTAAIWGGDVPLSLVLVRNHRQLLVVDDLLDRHLLRLSGRWLQRMADVGED
jgi:hypothetical protein